MSDVQNQVSGPATGLQVTAGIGIAYQIVMILIHLLGMGANATLGGDNKMFAMFSGTIGIVFGVIGIIIGAVVFMGGSKMKNLQGYGFVLTAAILAMIPCISPCCLLGLPIGIWAVVVLVKPEVKAAFTA
ncbi:MAG TPA: hypothetical protein VL181_07620 [Holophagaceae bacterium]|nr:hypothetical protein [Holophagaceae bacterium]